MAVWQHRGHGGLGFVDRVWDQRDCGDHADGAATAAAHLSV